VSKARRSGQGRGELSVKATEVFLLARALQPLSDNWYGLTDVEVLSH
jgi:lysyl-tRNA synthetase class II